MDTYEKKYKEIVGLIKKAYLYAQTNSTKAVLEEIFPELKESEDERIRKGLIKAVSRTFEGNKLFGTDVTREEALAWLEKQGEKKPTDNIEPKFKVGDWITNGDYTWKIVEVEPLDYILQSQDGNIVDDTTSHVDEQFHSFTIEDAKDGDVLALKNDTTHTLICMSPTTCDTGSYCRLRDGFFIKNKEYGWASVLLTPATKEQRDLLFQKMHKAGYEWDAEKKELKKIEQKPQRMISAEAKEAD